MKKLSFILAIMFSLSLIFTSCTKEEVEPQDSNIVPESFSVEIPASLMSSTLKSVKSTDEDILNGNEIYYHLTTFIKAGDEAAHIVSDIILHIRAYNLSQPMSFTFQSDEDGRAKNVVITENSEFDGALWQYQMNITDADSEGNEDGGLGIQIFWNKSPVKGIAIIKPNNFEKDGEDHLTNAMVRIDYTEDSDNYEKEMTVFVSGLTLENPLVNPYSMSTMKMTAGKNGNTIEVFGNSNHPNAKLFTSETGFNWAFVAAGSNVSEIGVAEVGLPPSNLNSTNRSVILEEYSIKNVFTNQITETWPELPSELINAYLLNTEAPGYFNNNGFVAAGVAPGPEYGVFETALESLTPFNPIEVSNLTIEFKL